MWRALGNLLNTSKKKSNNSISRIIVNNKILNKGVVIKYDRGWGGRFFKTRKNFKPQGQNLW